MRELLFVDDDPNVLSGLKRMFHKMRGEWQMEFAPGGDEALEVFAKHPIDVIVSDMRMPGMNGAQLLKKVSEISPGTVRFILSGHSDQELILQTVGHAHQYLAKPCDPELLVATVKRSVALHELLANRRLHEKIANTRSLPLLPSVYNRLVVELQSENGALKKVADIISEDIGMTAKILQLVNSAFFGMPTHVESPFHAVKILGMETVRALVLTISVFGQLQASPLMGLSLEKIYDHSLFVGTSAQRIARSLRLTGNYISDAFLGGMMHDIGKLLLLMHFRRELEAVVNKAKATSTSMQQIEQEALGVGHAEIGAHLLSLWGLPDSIVEAVAFHHTPSFDVSRQPSPLTAVYLANLFYYEIKANDLLQQPGECNWANLDSVGIRERIPRLRELCEPELVGRE